MPSRVISGIVRAVDPPLPILIISGGWPSALISVLALGLPLKAAYFPSRFHQYFKPSKHQIMAWSSPLDFTSTTNLGKVCFVISGTVSFLRSILSELSGTCVARSIVSVEGSRRDATRSALRQLRFEGKHLLVEFGLRSITFNDWQSGGATDGFNVFGFGHGLLSSVLPVAESGLALSLRHFIDGGTEGTFPRTVPQASVPVPLASTRSVLWQDNILQPGGLFPSTRPRALAYCACYRFPGRLVVRALARVELLRIYQIPLSMDELLLDLDPSRPLPFEDSASSGVFTSVFRQLWGFNGGGNTNGVRIEEEGTKMVDGRSDGCGEELVEMEEFVEEELEMEEFVEEEGLGLAPAGVTQHPRAMTAPSGPDFQGVVSDSPGKRADGVEVVVEPPVKRAQWHFDLGDGFDSRKERDALTDEDTLTSTASEETMLPRKVKRLSVLDDLEEHEVGGILYNPGPPFAIGDVIMCDVARQGMQRAFVLKANHPRYTLRLEDGTTVGTSTYEAWLAPRYATWPGNPNGLAADQDDPFAEVRSKTRPSRIGSYGVLGDAQRDSLHKVEEAKDYSKAVKHDDANIPLHLWNDRVKAGDTPREKVDWALDVFRKVLLRWYMRRLTRDCVAHMREAHGKEWMTRSRSPTSNLEKDREAIAGLLWHSSRADWFEYHSGSRLIHFRFPLRYRAMARDGVPVYFEKPGPSTKGKQPIISDPILREKTREKIGKVISRRYLVTTEAPIKSFIKYFAVPKGEDDIRLVYDATANKLNDCVWVPTFWLPTIDTLVRGVDGGSWMTDRDVGDMFLNYALHYSVCPFTGVDLSSLYANPEDAGPRWAIWVRNLMGFAASPYSSIKMALVTEEMCKGNRFEVGKGADGKELNPFQWSRIKLNLPGTPEYNPCESWLTKRREDGRIACDVFTFVDDERLVGPDEDLTWEAGHTLASKQAYFGVQDAGRKARPCSQTTGAWAGAIVHVLALLGVCVLTSKEKWTKLKNILKKWAKVLDESRAPKLSHKELLADRGFLVYVTRTYPAMVPYLKGFHLTIEMWRGGRDEEGWKLKEVSDDSSVISEKSVSSLDATRAGRHGRDLDRDSAYLPGRCEDEDTAAASHRMSLKFGKEHVYAPEDGLTTPAPRLKDDIAALQRLSGFELPPLRVVRPTQVVHVFYGFGDASGKQFGSTISEKYNCKSRLSRGTTPAGGVRFRIGLWSAEEEAESSNYKELQNLVNAIGAEAKAGRLQNCELFMFTDNSTAESCFYRGTSKSRQLHRLILDLRMMEMDFGLTIHIIHISGKRMIAQGTDGCSRGSLMEGVMAGEDMLSFIELSRTAVERHPPLLDWVRSWTERPSLEPLTPEGWFEEGHGITGGAPDRNNVWIPTHGRAGQLFLWAPPPAVADAALEELLKARHKRTDTFHVVVVPRIMTPRWRRLFNKSCDFTFVVSPGSPFWPDSMFEPLWVGIALPFVKHRPWSLKRAPLLVEMGGRLRGLLETSDADARNLLRKLLLLPRRVDSLPFRLACGVLHVPWPGDATVPEGSHNG